MITLVLHKFTRLTGNRHSLVPEQCHPHPRFPNPPDASSTLRRAHAHTTGAFKIRDKSTSHWRHKKKSGPSS